MRRFVIIALLTLWSVGQVHADPIVHLALEGRRQGTEDPFRSDLQVQSGDLVEYRLRVKLDAPSIPYDQIPRNSLGWMLHGISSMALEISQDSTDGIQVDFDMPAALTRDSSPGSGDGWGSGIGARGGMPQPRSGTAFDDLGDIRPIHAPGIFTAVDWETVLTGVFEVALVGGPLGHVRGRWGTIYEPPGPVSPGGFRWDGRTLFTHGDREYGSNPYSDYVPLTLTANLAAVPEPSTIALLAALIGTIAVIRKRVGR